MFDKMTDLDKTLVLTWFRWHMSMEQRRILMEELPVAYNHMTGRDIMETRVKESQ